MKGHIIDLVSRRIFDGEITVKDGRIAAITECEVEASAPYYMPGFIDSHVHIESSMMTPAEFARVAMSHGTVGAVCDPHEIANVLGTEGILFMLNNAKQSPFHFAFGMPSCVPSCSSDIETAGFVLGSDIVAEFMKRDDIYFLAEMMNFPGVLFKDAEVMAKIAAAKANGKPVDGHAPGLVGDERKQYAAAGISTDHECNTMETGRAAVECGMIVQIREGSAAKDYAALAPLIAEAPGQVMFCTDDCHPDDFVLGHIDRIVRRAIADGYDIMDVLTAACLTPAKHYGIPTGLLQVGDPADFIAVSDLTPDFRVLNTYIAGSQGQVPLTQDFGSVEPVPATLNNFHAHPITESDLISAAQSLPRSGESEGASEFLPCIVATDGSLFTLREDISISTVKSLPRSGELEGASGASKLVVINRYAEDAVPQVAYIKGFNLKKGAIAQTIAHDCHNIVAVGSDDKELVRVINRVVEMQGGIAVSDGEVLESLPLPIAGLISPLGADELAAKCQQMGEVVKRAGSQFHSPFITLGFMCLPVIPQLKLTDKGLFDSVNFQFVR